MKLVIYGQAPDQPISVRLRPDPEHEGITMEAYVGSTWQPICTLTDRGTLGLWDVRNRGLSGAGFQMTSTMGGHKFDGPIRTHLQQ